jgi:glycosyltransferase involved in cell wall biosynthesis
MTSEPGHFQGEGHATMIASPGVPKAGNGEILGAEFGVSVIIPAYNEEAAVAGVIRHIREVLTAAGLTHEVVIVDDGSVDQTARRAEEAGATILRHIRNRGYGASLKTGIIAAKYDMICITDADGTYPAETIPQLVEGLKTADMVVGARIGKSVAIPLVRKPAKWVLNRLANYITASNIPDLNSGLRAFRRPAAMQYFHFLPDQFSFTTTFTMAMHCDKYAVEYLPIDYRKRTGKSKIVPWDAVNFAVLIMRMAMMFRPLRVFLPVAFLCFLYAFGKAFVDFVITGDRMVSTTAAMAGLSGLQILLIGGLGDAISTRLWHMGGTRYPGAAIRHTPSPRDGERAPFNRGVQP